MHLETATLKTCWVVSYNLLGKSFVKKFDTVPEADMFMYQLISFANKHLDNPKLFKQVGDVRWPHKNSKVVRRWKIMIKQFSELDVIAV